MTVINFPNSRQRTIPASGYSCPGFCQLPPEHPFTDGDAELDLPFRYHRATVGGATASRLEFMATEQDGAWCTSWDGDPDLPDVSHEHQPPWSPWQAVQVARDLSALTTHIAQNRHCEGNA